MKREIKFRVWHEGKIKHYMPQFIFRDYEGGVIEQYTGLTDKNGKDIYEGDILDFPSKSAHEDGVVQWIDGGFWLRCGGQHSMPREELREVIGNIHEESK